MNGDVDRASRSCGNKMRSTAMKGLLTSNSAVSDKKSTEMWMVDNLGSNKDSSVIHSYVVT